MVRDRNVLPLPKKSRDGQDMGCDDTVRMAQGDRRSRSRGAWEPPRRTKARFATAASQALEFDEAGRPAVHEGQRHAVRTASAVVQEVQSISVDGRREVGQPVQGGAALGSIILVPPIGNEVSEKSPLHSVGPVGDDRVVPARRREPAL
jgi:hypothetical protein